MRRYLLPMLLFLLISGSLTAAGCEAVGYVLYLFAPGEEGREVQPEFTALRGQTVALAIYTDQGVDYEYPFARLSLSTVMRSQLKEKVKDVTVIEPRRVVAYQHENIRWDTMDKTALAKNFDADYLLYIVLDNYTTREPGAINLYRGLISGEARLYDASMPEGQACVWRGEDVRVMYPEKAPVGEPARDDSKIRYETEKRFAEKIIRAFHKHKVNAQ